MQDILRHCFLWQDTTFFITLQRNGFGKVIPLNLQNIDTPAIEIGPDMQPMGPQLHWHYIASELLTNFHLPPSLNRKVWELEHLRNKHSETGSPRTETMLLRAQDQVQSTLGAYLSECINQGLIIHIE